jgi:hypothetical protein
VRSRDLAGYPGEEILARALAEARVLVTELVAGAIITADSGRLRVRRPGAQE